MTRLYDRHKAEFSASMTALHLTPSLGQGIPPVANRLFSLCGKGLSRWRFVKPRLVARLTALEWQSQSSLLLE
ncbi:hypothetical protein GCM10027202_17830 [Microvirgula curvata]